MIQLSRENNHAKIIVRDNGVGIVKESVDKIFVKFIRSIPQILENMEVLA